MANATTPTEMVASDQLFKSALQQSNTSISDKLEELSKVFCPKFYEVNQNLKCDLCQLKDTCVSKTRIEQLKQDISGLTDERTQLMTKYSELQDAIKNYLLS